MISVEKGFWKLFWIRKTSASAFFFLFSYIYVLIFVLVIKDASQTSFIDLHAAMIGIE